MCKVEEQLRSRWGEYMPQVFTLVAIIIATTIAIIEKIPQARLLTFGVMHFGFCSRIEFYAFASFESGWL